MKDISTPKEESGFKSEADIKENKDQKDQIKRVKVEIGDQSELKDAVIKSVIPPTQPNKNVV